MPIDNDFKKLAKRTLAIGANTQGRTPQSRTRLLEPTVITYDCHGEIMNLFSLRKNEPKLAICETLGFLAGARSVSELERTHSGLKLWRQWSANDERGSLGGVYGDAFHSQYPKILKGLKNDPLSTHHVMTTLIPSKFPDPTVSYDQNVKDGKFSLMPCLHSFHFLSDGTTLTLHATQRSGDLPIGVFPHNAYQIQFLLILTAKLTNLKPGYAHHHIHDLHIYDNQRTQVIEMCDRKSKRLETKVHISNGIEAFICNRLYDHLAGLVTLPDLDKSQMHPPITIPVDS